MVQFFGLFFQSGEKLKQVIKFLSLNIRLDLLHGFNEVDHAYLSIRAVVFEQDVADKFFVMFCIRQDSTALLLEVSFHDRRLTIEVVLRFLLTNHVFEYFKISLTLQSETILTIEHEICKLSKPFLLSTVVPFVIVITSVPKLIVVQATQMILD